MSVEVTTTIFFNDGSKMTLGWPQQAGDDPATIAMHVRKALELDKLAIEVDGDLLVIPMQSVKYIQLTPAPPELPKYVVKQAHLLG